jgi:chromatin structure-remodeling complex subunit RSC1/2
LAKNRYKDPLQVYEDLNLVFLNAVFYNEEESQISRDASDLKVSKIQAHSQFAAYDILQILLDNEWRARIALPPPPETLPTSSAQVHHGVPLPKHLEKAPVVQVGKIVAVPSALAVGPSSPKHITPSTSVHVDRPSSPDMDVDVGGTPEPETMPTEVALDGESDAIVQQLERSLPRWEGFTDVGWSGDIPEVNF